MPRVRSLLCLFAVLLCAAQARAAEPATADALFREARIAMDRGEWERARSLLAESQRLEPAPGTLLNLAIAERKLGKLSRAWEHARSALDQLAPSDDRRPVASELYDSLDKETPRLILRSPASLPSNVKVQVDGVAISPAALGVPLPLDPGAHTLAVTAPGREPRRANIKLELGQRLERTVELGERIAEKRIDPGPQPVKTFPWQTAGWITAGVGAAGLVCGGVTGYLAIQRNNTVEGHCDGRYCDDTGADAAADGRTFATASTATVIAGAALVAAGTLMIVLAPGKTRTPVSGWQGPRGLRF